MYRAGASVFVATAHGTPLDCLAPVTREANITEENNREGVVNWLHSTAQHRHSSPKREPQFFL